MNEVTSSPPVSAATLQHVIADGDLSRLTPAQRVEYMLKVCETVGLNPLTRPFRFLQLNGQVTLYATRDCADQLRSSRKIDLQLIEKRLDGDLFVVTARATTPEGRHDEDVGAVMLGRLQGDARANAVMKAITKAKRRVTLSVCGLGFLDESEVETLAGVQVYDAAAEPEPVPAPSLREQINDSVPLVDAPPKSTPRMRVAEWLDELERALLLAGTPAAVDNIIGRDDVAKATGSLTGHAQERLNKMIRDASRRVRTSVAVPPLPDANQIPDWVGLDEDDDEATTPSEDQR